MALIVCKANLLSPPLSLSSSSSSPSAAVGGSSNWRYAAVPLSNRRCLTTRICCAPSPASQAQPRRGGRPKFKDFPYASPPIRDLMLELLSMVETRLGPKLVPPTLPPDVEYYTNESGTNHGSLYIRSGAPQSRVDLLLGHWQHCEVPNGGPTDLTSLRCFMDSCTDAPQLVVEFAQYSPTYLRFNLDLQPRLDLALNPKYLKKFYLKTELDELRKLILCSVPECGPAQDSSTSLYSRSAFSPTAITVGFITSGETRLERIISTAVRHVAKKVVETWLDVCVFGDRWRVTPLSLRPYFKQRDWKSKMRTVNIDIGYGWPELFGEDVVDRVHSALGVVLVPSESEVPGGGKPT